MNAQELWNKYKKINPSIGDVNVKVYKESGKLLRK